MWRLVLAAVALAAGLVACQGDGAATHRPGQSPGSPSSYSGVLSGRVTDGAGNPIEGANISIELLSPPFTSTQEGLATTADGTFESRENAGTYRVSATVDGETMEKEIELEVGETVEVRFEFDS